MSWFGCANNNRVFPFFVEEEKEEADREAEYVVRVGGYMDPDGTAASAATIYKNRIAVRAEYMMLNVKTDPIEVGYHGLVLGLNLLISMKIREVKIEVNDNQLIENMENGLRGHTKPVMRLHAYAESCAKKVGKIEYDLIPQDANKHIISICRRAVEKECLSKN